MSMTKKITKYVGITAGAAAVIITIALAAGYMGQGGTAGGSSQLMEALGLNAMLDLNTKLGSEIK